MVSVIEGTTIKEVKNELIERHLKEHMAYYQNEGIDEKEAMKLVAKDRGISKSIIYQELKRK
jgi:16S rRNA (cytidine1402-2'-O)-methyltransferase